MKKLLPIILLAACSHTATEPEIGDTSRCQRTTAASLPYTVRGDPNTYVLEVGICAYRISGSGHPLPSDSLVIVIARSELEAAARRVH